MRRNVLLSGGPQHDFDQTSSMLADLLLPYGIGTTIVDEPADAAAALSAPDHMACGLFTVNALRWNMGPERAAEDRSRWSMRLTDSDADAMERHVLDGGGLLAMHTAVICFDDHPRWRQLVGAAWDWDRSDHPPIGPIEVRPTSAGRLHPITADITEFTVFDELYRNVALDADVIPLLSGACDGDTHPVLWARELGDGRTVTCLLGHGTESLEHPSLRALVRRAYEWVLRIPTSHGASPT